MKVAVATCEQAGEGWQVFPTDYVRPAEIRRRLRHLAEAEDAGGPEVKIVTMNRTVLDQVRWVDSKNVGAITFEDVLVWDDATEKLVPLIERHSIEWLCNAKLGTIFESGQL